MAAWCPRWVPFCPLRIPKTFFASLEALPVRPLHLPFAAPLFLSFSSTPTAATPPTPHAPDHHHYHCHQRYQYLYLYQYRYQYEYEYEYLY